MATNTYALSGDRLVRVTRDNTIYLRLRISDPSESTGGEGGGEILLLPAEVAALNGALTSETA